MTADRDITCQEAQELVPLFVAGSLDEEAADPLRDHLDHCPECRRALGESAQILAAADQHLPSDWLVDLADGRPLGSEESQLAQHHLEHCSACRELLSMARMAHEGNDLEKAEGTRETRGEITQGPWLEPQAPKNPSVGRPHRRENPSSLRGWLAAAAILVLSIGWLGTWRQLQDSWHAEAPVMGALIEVPPLTAERGEGERTEIRLDGSPYLVLVLISDLPLAADMAARLEVRDPGGEMLFSLEDLRRDESGLYSIVLPSQGLEPGLYQAEVLEGGRSLERFEFRVVTE